jgi:hypothetical protein
LLIQSRRYLPFSGSISSSFSSFKCFSANKSP